MAKITWRQTRKIPEQVFIDVERVILDHKMSPRIIVRFLQMKEKILVEADASEDLIGRTIIRAAQISARHNISKGELEWHHRARI